jgi:hypothetical protein
MGGRNPSADSAAGIRYTGQTRCSKGNHRGRAQTGPHHLPPGNYTAEFDDSRFAADQLRYEKRQEAKLRAKARALGFQLIPADDAGVAP